MVTICLYHLTHFPEPQFAARNRPFISGLRPLEPGHAVMEVILIDLEQLSQNKIYKSDIWGG
jgi:hypothetical protein